MPLRMALHRMLAATALLAACQSHTGFEHGYGSPATLAEAVLNGIAERDRPALEALLVTRAEHEDLLWDQLPESRDVSFIFARDLNERNSRKGLERALATFGGQRFELVRIDLTDDAEQYDGFTVHYVDRLVVRRVSDGREGTLDILDVVVEYGGRWKLMNYEE